MSKMWKLVNFCELNKYAVKSYCAVHKVDESFNLGDITQVDEAKLADFTMMCGGSPCQDFSTAGVLKGALWQCVDCGYKYNPLEAHWSVRDKCPVCNSKNIEKTRSSLLAEYLRVLRAKHPKFAMYENVKNIVGKQFKTTFDMFIKELDDYGYNTYWQVLNAKDYGIPQNRERVYIFIVDKELDNGLFRFPEKFDNGVTLKDMLDKEIEDKYYISEARMKIIQKNLGDVFSDYFIIGNSQKNPFKGDGTIAPCLTSAMGNGGGHTPMLRQPKAGTSNIRKLTPEECWRLMGFSAKYFNAAKAEGMSDSQLYVQAGNSIVTDVLYYIYLEIYKAMPYLFDDLTVTSLFSGIGAFEIALNRLFDTINKQ